MARIRYADPASPETRDLADRIVAERGELLQLYRMLLHSPPVAEGWLSLLTAVRQKASLPGSLREMVIIRIAHLNGATYEAEQHAPIALREGVSEVQLDALDNWNEKAHLFDQTERAALELTDQMTLQVQVGSRCWEGIAAQWSERQIVDLVVTIAAYNMVSRVLAALQITTADAQDPD